MKNERVYQRKVVKISQQRKQQSSGICMPDNRPGAIMQARLCNAIQRSGVIQRGHEKYVPQDNRALIDYVERDGVVMFYTTKGGSFFIETCDLKDKYLGEVEIDVVQFPLIVLHTRSTKMGGLAPYMFIEALRRIQRDFNKVQIIRMTPAPGAASKKVIEMLSMIFGNPMIHEQAEELQAERKESYKRRKKIVRPAINRWDTEVLNEYYLHLKALVDRNFPGLFIQTPVGIIMGTLPQEPAKAEATDSEEDKTGQKPLVIPRPPIPFSNPEAYIALIRDTIDEITVCPGPGIDLYGPAIQELLREDMLIRIMAKMREEKSK